MERLTHCCKAVAEYTEGVLCCQVCYEEVSHEEMSVTHGFEWRGQPFTLTQTPPPPVIPIQLDNSKGGGDK